LFPESLAVSCEILLKFETRTSSTSIPVSAKALRLPYHPVAGNLRYPLPSIT
jgi:hypothetical protein